MQIVGDVTAAFLLTFAGLFPIVNPLESAPLFLDLTRHCDTGERNRLVREVTFNSFFLLLGSMLLGPWMLGFFGIDLPVVRIAGGLVVVSVGWKLFSRGDTQWSGHAPAVPIASAEIRSAPVRSFYPLTMPLTVGPGSMSIAIAIGSRKPTESNDLLQWLWHISGAVLGLAAIGASIYVCYRYAGHLVRALGETGADVLVRLSAFLLMCIGVQIIWGGYSTLVATLPH
jgi:multiple antibiotic resistance protein